jgi:hypothetical protein
MGNSISRKNGKVVVTIDPWHLLTQPASLPGKDGQPTLTGFSFGNMVEAMVRQIVGIKSPEIYAQISDDGMAATVKWENDQFIVTYEKLPAWTQSETL